MKRFLREMRRREVFRTAGLYVGVAWIAIEVASVLLPTFDAPEWVLRWLVIAAVVGFPVAIVLSWVFDVTEHGIVVQDEATDESFAPIGSRKTDFVVIGVLTVALTISLYINFTRTAESLAAPDPVTVLIADFDNRTGNPLFDGSLEQALAIGIEGAPFINAYRRDQALGEAQELDLGQALDEDTARLVSVRRDVQIVLAGMIESDGNRLRLALRAIDPATGEERSSARSRADNSTAVLAAINELAADIRDDLGDSSSDLKALRSGESLTTSSLPAIKEYTAAQLLARDGRDEEAVDHYRAAVELDPEFARAWSGWGLSAFKMGRRSEADELWGKALSLTDRMTERERYRTYGLYYTAVSLNYAKAIENYRELVERFPGDGAGNNNLAILYVFTAQYDKALEQSRKLLEIYPGRTLYHANHAQYAVYAGNMDTAVAEATRVIDDDPGFFKSYMILAIAALYNGDAATAEANYRRMASTGERGRSLAGAGLADLAMYEGRVDEAVAFLEEGIEQDRATGDERGVATKTVALAQARLAGENSELALELLRGLPDSRADGQLLPIAEMFIKMNLPDDVTVLGEVYKEQLRPTAAAYARLIDGLLAKSRGDYMKAIAELTAALDYADLWIVRFHLGQAYLAGGYAAEANDEFTACHERRGEAGNLFFDDVPTWRYTAALADWKAAAGRELSGVAAAR